MNHINFSATIDLSIMMKMTTGRVASIAVQYASLCSPLASIIVPGTARYYQLLMQTTLELDLQMPLWITETDNCKIPPYQLLDDNINFSQKLSYIIVLL